MVFLIFVFDKMIIHTDKINPHDIVIEKRKTQAGDQHIKRIELGGKTFGNYRISHEQLVKGGRLTVYTNSR